MAYEVTLDVKTERVEVMTSTDKWVGVWRWSGASNFKSDKQTYFSWQVQVTVNDALNESEEVKAWREADPKVRALALHEEEDLDDVSELSPGYEIGRRMYLVLTDDEADEMARERAVDTLWAFSGAFLSGYIPALQNKRALDAFTKMQQELCEGAGPLVEAMLGDKLGDMLDTAIGLDGRGHFLSSYDGVESDIVDPLSGERFFIYRQ